MKQITICIATWLLIGIGGPATMSAQGQETFSTLSEDTVKNARAGANSVLYHKDCELQPVWFDYTRRRLYYNGAYLKEGVFLKICRTINDSAVQQQLALYDELSGEKQRLGVGMLGSSFAGFALLGGAISSEGTEPELARMLGGLAVVAILAVPAMAIYSSWPHQHRKTVLFCDLPIAYNAYVEACRQSEACNP